MVDVVVACSVRETDLPRRGSRFRSAMPEDFDLFKSNRGVLFRSVPALLVKRIPAFRGDHSRYGFRFTTSAPNGRR